MFKDFNFNNALALLGRVADLRDALVQSALKKFENNTGI